MAWIPAAIAAAGQIASSAMDKGGGGGGGSGGDNFSEKKYEDIWKQWATPEVIMQYQQLPEFKEGEQARKWFYHRLMDWRDYPYGAVSPDWSQAWQTAKDRIGRYFWGGPNMPGVADKIRASAARRGVSQGPAMETMLGRMGAEEGANLRELATSEATKRADLAESSRQNWMQSLLALTGIKPTYQTVGGIFTKAQGGTKSGWQNVRGTGGEVGGDGFGIGDILGAAGEAGGNIAGEYAQQKWFEDWLKKQQEPKKTDPFSTEPGYESIMNTPTPRISLGDIFKGQQDKLYGY